MISFKNALKGLAILASSVSSYSCHSQPQNGWTIIYYAVGSNSSEVDLLDDIGEMMKGKTSKGYEVITLIDRTEGHSEDSTTLGENFNDTRLYRLSQDQYEELDGGELLPEMKLNSEFDANMADADVLKRFVQYCKRYFPAKHYMLVLRSHGNGVGMCPDPETGIRDKLYPGEIRDVLSKDESVDILGLDVCSMAGLENLYEWRPGSAGFSADYVIASAPLSAAWAYDDIFERLSVEDHISQNDQNYFSEGFERTLNPRNMTPKEFSKLLMEEIYDSQRWASWGLFDNTKIGQVKNAIDDLAKELINENDELIKGVLTEALGYHHNTSNDLEIAQLTFPYVDAYDLFKRISIHKGLSDHTIEKARSVIRTIDELVVYSYYGRGFLPPSASFLEGKSGAYIIFPEGDKTFSQSGSSFWSHTTWYHPDDKNELGNAYGLYDWSSDNAIRGNNKVDNFFEYLDYLFDTSNGNDGGVNGYQW